MKKIKLPWKILLGVMALLLAAVLGYLIYVFAAYYRVEDNQTLTVETAGDSACPSLLRVSSKSCRS